jgi:hypothetical protein
MTRRIIAIFVGITLALGVTACSSPKEREVTQSLFEDTTASFSATSAKVEEVEGWSDKDLSFYDADGEEMVFVTSWETLIYLSENPELKTYRGVKIGDRAKTALNKYPDIPNSFLYISNDNSDDNYAFDSLSDIEDVIIEHSLKKEHLTVAVVLDKDLVPIPFGAIQQSINSDNIITLSFVGIIFEIDEEKITEVTISNQLNESIEKKTELTFKCGEMIITKYTDNTSYCFFEFDGKDIPYELTLMLSYINAAQENDYKIIARTGENWFTYGATDGETDSLSYFPDEYSKIIESPDALSGLGEKYKEDMAKINEAMQTP